jgi:hypothetical protein
VLPQSELFSSSAGLPTAECRGCGRRVLVHEGEQGVLCCVHCDKPVGAVALVGEEDLDGLGYGVFEEAKSGCATGCGSGGCGIPRPDS